MTLPNLLTFLRLILVVGVAAALERPDGNRIALVLFAVAAATDWLDGHLARRLHQTSELGALLDPLVDKVLVTAALVGLAARGVVPAWAVTLVLAREFLVSGFRVLVAKTGSILPAGWSGKIKTATQMAAITLLLYPVRPVGDWVFWASVALTAYSGAEYLWEGRLLLRG